MREIWEELQSYRFSLPPESVPVPTGLDSKQDDSRRLPAPSSASWIPTPLPPRSEAPGPVLLRVDLQPLDVTARGVQRDAVLPSLIQQVAEANASEACRDTARSLRDEAGSAELPAALPGSVAPPANDGGAAATAAPPGDGGGVALVGDPEVHTPRPSTMEVATRLASVLAVATPSSGRTSLPSLSAPLDRERLPDRRSTKMHVLVPMAGLGVAAMVATVVLFARRTSSPSPAALPRPVVTATLAVKAASTGGEEANVPLDPAPRRSTSKAVSGGAVRGTTDVGALVGGTSHHAGRVPAHVGVARAAKGRHGRRWDCRNARSRCTASAPVAAPDQAPSGSHRV